MNLWKDEAEMAKVEKKHESFHLAFLSQIDKDKSPQELDEINYRKIVNNKRKKIDASQETQAKKSFANNSFLVIIYKKQEYYGLLPLILRDFHS
jgi:hypothetical protein